MKIYKVLISSIFMVTSSLTTFAQHDHSSMGGSSSNMNSNMNSLRSAKDKAYNALPECCKYGRIR